MELDLTPKSAGKKLIENESVVCESNNGKFTVNTKGFTKFSTRSLFGEFTSMKKFLR
jgi:hypothetical protein